MVGRVQNKTCFVFFVLGLLAAIITIFKRNEKKIPFKKYTYVPLNIINNQDSFKKNAIYKLLTIFIRSCLEVKSLLLILLFISAIWKDLILNHCSKNLYRFALVTPYLLFNIFRQLIRNKEYLFEVLIYLKIVN